MTKDAQRLNGPQWTLHGALGLTPPPSPPPPSPGLLQELSAPLAPYSLFFLSRTNPIRRLCVVVTHNKLFDWFMLGCILGNCVTLAMAPMNKPGFQVGFRFRGLRHVFVCLCVCVGGWGGGGAIPVVLHSSNSDRLRNRCAAACGSCLHHVPGGFAWTACVEEAGPDPQWVGRTA